MIRNLGGGGIIISIVATLFHHIIFKISSFYEKKKKRFELYAKKQEIKAHIQGENRNFLLGSPDFELTKDFKLSIIIKILKKHVH